MFFVRYEMLCSCHFAQLIKTVHKKSFVKVLNFDKAFKNLSNSVTQNLCTSEPMNLCEPFYKKSPSETPSFILISDILISNSKPAF